jgi:toxin-antitoxin system PIN domain toxin
LHWLEGCINADQPFGLSELVLSGFLKIFSPPSPLEPAIRFAGALRTRSNCVLVAPGPRHWEIFSRLCLAANAKGNLIPDAYLAALAIESGTEWITSDRDFSRFPGLQWRHPFD